MNERLSTATDNRPKLDVSLLNSTVTDESTVIDVRHLSVDPKTVACFREQLKEMRKNTGNLSILEGKKENKTPSSVETHEAKPETLNTTCESKPHKSQRSSAFLKSLPKTEVPESTPSGNQSMNERKFVEKPDRQTLSFISSSESNLLLKQNHDGSHQTFNAKSAVQFDIKTSTSPYQTNGFADTSDLNSVSEISLKTKNAHSSTSTEPQTDQSSTGIPTGNPMHKFKNPKTASTSVSTHGTTSENQTNKTDFSGRNSHISPTLPQSSATLKGNKAPLRKPTVPPDSTHISEPTSRILSSEMKKSDITFSSGNRLDRPSNIAAKFNISHSSLITSSKTPNGAFAEELTLKTGKTEHSRSSENTLETGETAVIDTIPFLRTITENTDSVQNLTATQSLRSHAILVAQQIKDHIIDRILISSSELNAKRTVTVQLSPRLLRNTEIQFTKNGTSLDVRLVSTNKESVQFLQQQQSDLQTYLQGELKMYRSISVQVASPKVSSDLTQPHDGRSRNRFVYTSTDEEEQT